VRLGVLEFGHLRETGSSGAARGETTLNAFQQIPGQSRRASHSRKRVEGRLISSKCRLSSALTSDSEASMICRRTVPMPGATHISPGVEACCDAFRACAAVPTPAPCIHPIPTSCAHPTPEVKLSDSLVRRKGCLQCVSHWL